MPRLRPCFTWWFDGNNVIKVTFVEFYIYRKKIFYVKLRTQHKKNNIKNIHHTTFYQFESYKE